MAKRFEMWVMLKTIGIGEVLLGTSHLICAWIELDGMARPPVVGAYSCS